MSAENPPLKKSEKSEKSEMVWDEDEVDTQPGVGPIDLTPSLPSPLMNIPASPPGRFPMIDSDGLAKSDVCYLCGTKKYLARFFRSHSDHVIACIACIYTHLGWELQSDGSLIPVPSDP